MSGVLPPISVMEIVHSMEVGGMERVVMHLVRNMDRSRYRPIVVCIARKGDFALALEETDVPVLCLDKPPGVSLAAPRKLAGMIRDHQVRIVHMHNSGPFFTGTLASVLRRVPVRVYTDHARDFPDRWRVMMTERVLGRLIDRAVAVSEETRQNLIRYLSIPANKIQVIPNGVEAPQVPPDDDLAELRREFGAGPGDLLVVVIARLEAQKAIHRMIDAARIVHERLPHVRFLVVGGGNLEGQLREMIRDRNLEEVFHLAGWRLDATALLAAADVFALSSNWEGLPMSLLEAIALSKPAVCPNVGDVGKAILDGESGCLVKPNDAAALAETLIGLLTDPERMAAMGARARRLFDERFGAATMARQYEALFEEVLCRKA